MWSTTIEAELEAQLNEYLDEYEERLQAEEDEE